MRFAFLLAFVLVAVSATSVDEEDWEFYKQEFNKKYSSGREHHYRKGVFLKNRDEILSHNARFEAGLATHKTGVNQFTDMGKEEFESYASCLKVPENSDSQVRKNEVIGESLNVTMLPEFIDWREKGAVTEVKNQGQCGSCWAFATIGSVEGRHFMESGKLVSLSEQNLIDCMGPTSGCDGGWSYNGFKFIIEEGGIDTEESYPYIESEYSQHPARKCHFKSSTIGASIKKVSYVGRTTQQLMSALVHKGPISIAIYAGADLQNYSGGIIESSGCFSQPNHAVLLVGYGYDKGEDYWLIKNSWGSKWGEGGYFRMKRGIGHDCMITSNALYAD